MRAWDYKTGQFYELQTRKQAVANGWLKGNEPDTIIGVKLMATPISIPARGICVNGVFSEGFDFIEFGSGVIWSEPASGTSR